MVLIQLELNSVLYFNHTLVKNSCHFDKIFLHLVKKFPRLTTLRILKIVNF